MATQIWSSTITLPATLRREGEAAWFAIHIKARHEKKVDATLRSKRLETFLPLVTKIQRWSDRRQKVEFPLFPCYSFVRLHPSAENLLAVLRTPGVVRLIGSGGDPLPVPEKQIQDIRRLLAMEVPYWEHPFLTTGRRVRIRGGCLNGVEGILTEMRSNKTLVISADPIQRSIAISAEEYTLEPA